MVATLQTIPVRQRVQGGGGVPARRLDQGRVPLALALAVTKDLLTTRTSESYPVRARAWGEEAGPLRCFSRMLTRVRLMVVDDSDVWAGATCLIRTRQGLQPRPLHCGGACCASVSASLHMVYLPLSFVCWSFSRVCAHELSSCGLW